MNTTPLENPTLDEIFDRLSKLEIFRPTPSELALVAATLARNDGVKPSEKLIEARKLIREADKLLNPKPEPARIPLNTRLEQLMPTITDPDYRKKKFFEFLCVWLRRGTNYTDEEIQPFARCFMHALKEKGVSPDEFYEFTQWFKEDKRRKKAAAGSKGGISKKQKADAKAKATADGKERKKRKKTKVWQKDLTSLPVTPDKEPMLGTQTLPE
jgi:hypothetical protein